MKTINLKISHIASLFAVVIILIGASVKGQAQATQNQEIRSVMTDSLGIEWKRYGTACTTHEMADILRRIKDEYKDYYFDMRHTKNDSGCTEVWVAVHGRRDGEISQEPMEHQKIRAEWIAIGNGKPSGLAAMQHNEAYKNYTPNAKQSIWIAKFEEVLELDWTEPERQHIQYILNLVTNNVDFFPAGSSLQDFRQKDEVVKWRAYAFKEFGLNPLLISEMLAPAVELTAERKTSIEKVPDVSPALVDSIRRIDDARRAANN